MSLPWSSKGSKGTPIAADELLIIDSADANPSTQNKRITIGTLPVIETTLWTANHDAGGFDLLNVGGITINNPADSFQYIVTPAAIVGDRILNLPLMTGTDTLVVQSFAQTITNKIFPGVSPNQFEDDGLVIQNAADTFNYTFQAAAIAADRTITLPLLTGPDTLVTEAFIQTLTNKTLDDFSNDVHANILHLQVRNETGGPLSLGDVVYISGFSVPEDLPLVELADASSSATMPSVGVITSGIADNTNGDITASGQLTGPSTTGLSANATLYVSETAGEFTDVKPTGTALIQNMGSVLKVGGVGVGVINVVDLARTNDLPNIADTNFWVGNASGVPTAVPMSVDATLSNTGALTIATNAVTDAKTNTFTTTKISTLNKALLNTAIVYNDQANTFGDFAQTFPDNQIFIQNPAATFEYQIIAAAIAADRTLTLPLLTGNDVIVTEAHTQTLTNKTIDGDDNTIIDINETQMNVSSGVSGTILTSNGAGLAPTYQADSSTQTPWIGNIDAATFSLLNLGGLEINNPADTFQYIITPDAILADRILNLPLMTGTDTILLEAFAATLTNKTVDLASNTLTGTTAEFNTALSDGSFATLAGSETLTNKILGTGTVFSVIPTINDGITFTFNPNTTVSGINVGAHTANPSVPVNGDIWYNSTTGQIFGRAGSTNVDLGAAGAASPPFADSTSIVEGSVDPTKEIRFEVDGLTTATIRVITPPDADITLVNTSDGLITNTNVDAAAAIVTTKLADSANFVLINQTNTFGDFAQTFADNQIFIENPAGTFEYQISAAGIAADRTVTLPLLLGNDTFVTEAFIQTLTNKTIDLTDNTVTGTTAEFNTALSDGDFATLAGTESITNKTFPGTTPNEFEDNGLIIQNPADTFNYIFQSAAIAADRTVTLPLLAGNTIMVVTDFANVWGTVNQDIAATGKWQEGGVSISPIGTQTIWANSGAWISTTTNGATFASRELPTNDVMISSFNFDDTTSQSAQVQWVPPPNWDAGTIRFRLYWTNAAGLTTETIDFDLAGRAYADSDAIDQVTGTAQNVTDTWLAQNDAQITSYSSAITLAGTPTAGELVILKLSRDVAADDLTGDAEIIGIEIEYSLDAATAT